MGHDPIPGVLQTPIHPIRRRCQWLDPESNRGHADFQSAALPTELSSLKNWAGRELDPPKHD